ncbi:MAG: FxsA family protein, partial [Solimonas sp.]
AVILGFVLGGLTIRHTGIKSLDEVREAGKKGYIGPNAAIGGMLGFLAGILFILPGLLSDIAAILLLLPFMRPIVERRMSRPSARQGGVVIEGEAVEIREERLPPETKHENNDDASPWNR